MPSPAFDRLPQTVYANFRPRIYGHVGLLFCDMQLKKHIFKSSYKAHPLDLLDCHVKPLMRFQQALNKQSDSQMQAIIIFYSVIYSHYARLSMGCCLSRIRTRKS